SKLASASRRTRSCWRRSPIRARRRPRTVAVSLPRAFLGLDGEEEILAGVSVRRRDRVLAGHRLRASELGANAADRQRPEFGVTPKRVELAVAIGLGRRVRHLDRHVGLVARLLDPQEPPGQAERIGIAVDDLGPELAQVAPAVAGVEGTNQHAADLGIGLVPDLLRRQLAGGHRLAALGREPDSMDGVDRVAVGPRERGPITAVEAWRLCAVELRDARVLDKDRDPAP